MVGQDLISRQLSSTKLLLQTCTMVLLFSAGILPAAQAEKYLDANVSSDAARFAFGFEVTAGKNPLLIEASYLYVDEDPENGNAFALGALVWGDAGQPATKLKAGLGGRLYALDIGPLSGGALGLGGEFSLRLPQFNRLGFEGRLYWAPEILGFGEFEGLLDLALRADYEVLRNAYVYLGYRLLNADPDIGGDDQFDSTVNLGLRIQF